MVTTVVQEERLLRGSSARDYRRVVHRVFCGQKQQAAMPATRPRSINRLQVQFLQTAV